MLRLVRIFTEKNECQEDLLDVEEKINKLFFKNVSRIFFKEYIEALKYLKERKLIFCIWKMQDGD